MNNVLSIQEMYGVMWSSVIQSWPYSRSPSA